MKRSMMQIYVEGSIEAVALYQKAFDAVLADSYKNEDGSYYHAELDIQGHILAVSEAHSMSDAKRNTGTIMQFCFHYGKGNEALVEKAYEILKDGSTIMFPLGPCDYSSLMVDMIDKFGVRWCLFV